MLKEREKKTLSPCAQLTSRARRRPSEKDAASREAMVRQWEETLDPK